MPKVSDLLNHKGNREVAVISMDSRAVDGARMLAEQHIGVLVCRDDGNPLAGVFSERDVVRAFAERPDALSDLLVQDLATRDVVTCTPDDELSTITKVMRQGGFRHLPVVNAGEVVGLVSVTDIFSYLTEKAPPHERTEILAAYASMSLPI